MSSRGAKMVAKTVERWTERSSNFGMVFRASATGDDLARPRRKLLVVTPSWVERTYTAQPMPSRLASPKKTRRLSVLMGTGRGN